MRRAWIRAERSIYANSSGAQGVVRIQRGRHAVGNRVSRGIVRTGAIGTSSGQAQRTIEVVVFTWCFREVHTDSKWCTAASH